MSFSRPSLSTLISRIEGDITSRLTGGVALLKQSLLKILARVFAGAIHSIYGYIQDLSLQIIVDKANTEFLDRHATMWGVPRKAASPARGTFVFTGTNGTNIPSGTVLINDAGVEYTTDSLVTISSGTATANITCSLAGAIGNLSASSTLSLVTSIAGIDPTGLTGLVSGGADQEDDESLRTRILARIQNPPMGGSASDYVAWAKSIVGVLNAYVFPAYYGGGTVVVCITIPGASPIASGGLITSVQTYIDSVRPVTATVTVNTVTAATINIGLSLNPNNSDTQTAINAAVKDLFAGEGIPGGTILLSHLQEAIAQAGGVNNYIITSITVNGGGPFVGDIILTAFLFPVLGTITFTSI